ncbi:MAG: sigma-70 family RNA polymerase sigma factor [Rubripirellula sp.]
MSKNDHAAQSSYSDDDLRYREAGLILDTQRLEHDDFLRLLLKSEQEILRYVMAIVPQADDAREVFQETAVALWKQIDKYDPSLPFTPWAFRFAANKAKEHLRKQARWKGFLDEEVASALLARREELSPELDLRVGPLRDCLSELSENNRTVIKKYYHDQASIEETAAEVGRSVSAAYKSLQRIRVALMECIDGKSASLEVSS